MTDDNGDARQTGRRRFLLAGTAAAGSFLILPSRLCAADCRLRLGRHGTRTRVVADLKGKPTYKVLPLESPPRLVVDMNAGAFDPLSAPPSSDLIRKIRFGRPEAGTLRMVLDLSRTAQVDKEFLLPPQSGFGWRLVLDLVPGEASGETTEKPQPSDFDGPVPAERPIPPRRPVVVLDPGHGGRDPGAIGVSGVYEKEITLAMAHQLGPLLEDATNCEVVLTRESDETLSLGGRVRRARAVNGDLFISLHADSISGKSSVRGLSVYTLSENASDNEAAELARRENKADIIAGIDLDNEAPEVSNILIDLTRRETMNLSSKFANLMVKEMVKSVQILRNTHRFAGFTVLKAPDIPSVLLEMGYLSNPKEARLLQTRRYRQRLARAVKRSVESYFTRVRPLA